MTVVLFYTLTLCEGVTLLDETRRVHMRWIARLQAGVAFAIALETSLFCAIIGVLNSSDATPDLDVGNPLKELTEIAINIVTGIRAGMISIFFVVYLAADWEQQKRLAANKDKPKAPGHGASASATVHAATSAAADVHVAAPPPER